MTPVSPTVAGSSPTPARPQQSLLRTVLWGAFLGALLALGTEAGRVYLAGNFHIVIPGRVYRCSQPSPERLARITREKGIRTIINLRGSCPGFEWFTNEARATAALGIAQEDICMSAGRLPSVPEIRRLVEVLDHTDYPVLFHCNRGADRTGLASTVALLLNTDTPYEDARVALSPRYGHVALGRPANLDRFFRLYEDWLSGAGLSHSPAHFRHWVLEEYCPGEGRARIEFLEMPEVVAPGRPFACKVRCHNESVAPWQFLPGSNAGIHVSFLVGNSRGKAKAVGRAGLFHKVVAPGESIDVNVVVPSLSKPGRYILMVDMVDEQHCCFYQLGSEPVEQEFEVRE